MNLSLAVATGNQHKLQEISSLLELDSGSVFSPRNFPGYEEPIEDGLTFSDNALIKAESLALHIQKNFPDHPFLSTPESAWIMADDSGLEVDALNGKPGVHSARFASDDLGLYGNAPDSANNSKLLQSLASVPDAQRTARFICVITIINAGSGVSHSFCGKCEGTIAREPSGDHGFGYDPLFIPNDHSQSMAELGDEVKSTLSHRFHALSQARQILTP